MGCQGLYADVNYVNFTIGKASKNAELYEALVNAYNTYKRSKVESLVPTFDTQASLGDEFSIAANPFTPLRVVQIFFATATYDENVKDVSVTLADQFGAIGGTMGLFAGFSFLSALEIVYYLMKALLTVANKRFSQV